MGCFAAAGACRSLAVVPELPPYRAADAEEGESTGRKVPWAAIGVAVVVVVLVVLMLVLHETGVMGAGIHGGKHGG
jgi:hypothetical protein